MPVQCLGLGLGSNLQVGDQPGPYRLLGSVPGLFDFVEYSAPLALEDARREASLWPTMWAQRQSVPVLYHPVHLNLWGPALESEERLEALAHHAAAVGSAWVGNDVAWWHVNGELFPGALYVPPPLTDEALDDCIRHARHVQRALPMPLALENPTVGPCRGPLHVIDFMAALHDATGCPLVLDLGHLFAHALARGVSIDDGLERLPWEAVIEIHVAGGIVTRHSHPLYERAVYLDDHGQPVRDEVLALLAEVAPRCTNLAALTFEGDGHPDPIARTMLERLRPHAPIAGAPFEPLPERAPDVDDEPPEVSGPWQVLSQVIDEDDPDDPIGAAVDLDYRLTVLAHQIDRHHPLTRPLLAGTRAALKDLGRALFGGGPPLPSWRVWATSRADEHADAWLALEVAAHDALARPPATVPRGRLALAADARLIEAPRDPAEMLFATRALRQHLAGRAAASEHYAASALDGLEAIAARAPHAPTWIAVRWRGRLELVSLSLPLADLLGRAARHGLGPGDVAPPYEAVAREAVAAGLIVKT